MKNAPIFLSNSANIFWHNSSQLHPGTIATKSSPPICPTNVFSILSLCTEFTIVSAVNSIIWSPFRKPYTSLFICFKIV